MDAFTGALAGRVLLGNPAAVVLLPQALNLSRFCDEWYQKVAAELNLSETAFLQPMEDGSYRLRWFTPVMEVDLCGHATLASAHVLRQDGLGAGGGQLTFHTRSGVLHASFGAKESAIELEFPRQEVLPCAAPANLAAALGLGLGHGLDEACHRASDDLLVEIPAERLPTLQPDFTLLRQLTVKLGVRGVIVTGWNLSARRTADGYDFVSRFFAPALGIDEDPVTGSAHTKLGPFWGDRHGLGVLVGWQASRRGGLIRVQIKQERVLLSGSAQTTLRGELLL